jgi:peptide deformylase
MQLLDYKNPILKEDSSLFSFTNPPFDPVELANDLVRYMYEVNAVSLAAIQVGIKYRIFAMRGLPQNFVVINPRIVMPSNELIELEETSVTYQNLIIKKTRPRHVKVRFALPNSEIKTETFSGITARVFQQNMDLLQGDRFWKGISKLKFDMAKKKAGLEFVTFR